MCIKGRYQDTSFDHHEGSLVTGVSGTGGAKEEVFGTRIGGSVLFSISHARKKRDYLPAHLWPESSFDQRTGPFSRSLCREGAKDSSSSFGRV